MHFKSCLHKELSYLNQSAANYIICILKNNLIMCLPKRPELILRVNNYYLPLLPFLLFCQIKWREKKVYISPLFFFFNLNNSVPMPVSPWLQREREGEKRGEKREEKKVKKKKASYVIKITCLVYKKCGMSKIHSLMYIFSLST